MSVEWNGRTFGQLSPAERAEVTRDAAGQLERELTMVLPVIMGEDDIDYGTLENPTFHVFRKDGTEVMINDELIDFRGEAGIRYLGCKHPRKVMTTDMGCEKYPSVFDLEIRGPGGYVWNPVTEQGRAMRTAYDAAGCPAW